MSGGDKRSGGPDVPRPGAAPAGRIPPAGAEPRRTPSHRRTRRSDAERAREARLRAAYFSAEEVARGRALRRAQWPAVVAGRCAELCLLLVLGLSPAGAAIVGVVGGPWWATALWGATALVVLGLAVQLPFSARVRVVRRRFGLVTQSWRGWWSDVLRGLGVALLLTAGAVVGVYALVRAFPDGWWIGAASAAGVLSVLLSWLAPLLLDPLFTRFTPMEEGPLRSALLTLASRDAVRVDEVLVADASRRTTALNAYVTGFGATRRIVVYDTLLRVADRREVELVVAHELAHVKHRDVLHGTVLGAFGAAAGACLVGLVVGSRPMLDAAGVERFADPRSLALLAAAVCVLATFAGPVGCAISRGMERRADRHALDLTADPGAFVAVQRRLSIANVSDVDPPRLVHALSGTHPTAVERIRQAREWTAARARERTQAQSG